MNKKRLLMGVLAAALLALSLGMPAVAQGGIVKLASSFVYDNTLLNARCTPLRVRVQNDGDTTLTGILGVDVTQETDVFDRLEMPISVAPGEKCDFWFDVQNMVVQNAVPITLMDAQGETLMTMRAVPTRTAPNDACIIGVWEDKELTQALYINAANDVLGMRDIFYALRLTEKNFPVTAERMRAFNLLVMDGADWAAWDDAPRAVVEDWLDAGGVLLLGGAPDASALPAFASLTGVSAVGEPFEADVLAALYDYTGAAQGTGVVQATALQGGIPLVTVQDKPVMCATTCGEGLIISCGFSLREPALLNAASTNALWQRVFLTMDQSRYGDLLSIPTPAIYYPRLARLRSPEGSRGLVPVVCLLVAYVLIAGVGLYVLFRRMDQCRWLWLALPMTAVLFSGGVALLSKTLNLNTPAVSAENIILYEPNGDVFTQEMAHLTAPGQQSLHVRAQDDVRMLHDTYAYFNDWTNADLKAMTLRDRVTIGEHPALTLQGDDVWKERTLRILSDRKPTGTLEAKVSFSREGLHAWVRNGLDTPLENACMLTVFGCVELGDIAPGAEASGFLPRETSDENTRIEHTIPRDFAMLYPAEMSEISNALLYPETGLSPREAEAAAYASERLGVASSYARDHAAPCMLVADAPAVGCTPLTVNDKPVTRVAQISLVLCPVEITPSEEDGYCVVPNTALPAHGAILSTQDVPRMGVPIQGWGVQCDERSGFGYDLSGIDFPIEGIRVSKPNDAILEVYDQVDERWVRLGASPRITIVGRFAPRAISENGELFLRYTNINLNEYMDLPQIVVEGGAAR